MGLKIFILSRNCHWLWVASTRELKILACRRKKLDWTSFFILPTKKEETANTDIATSGKYLRRRLKRSTLLEELRNKKKKYKKLADLKVLLAIDP